MNSRSNILSNRYFSDERCSMGRVEQMSSNSAWKITHVKLIKYIIYRKQASENDKTYNVL